MKYPILLTLALTAGLTAARAEMVAHFPFDLKGDRIIESISGATLDVNGNFEPESVAGAAGTALRFDGYSTRVDGHIGALLPAGSQNMTITLWMAAETWPVSHIDDPNADRVALVSCLDTDARTGFGFFLGHDGRVEFKTYSGGWEMSVVSENPVSRAQWVHLAAVVDGANRTTKLYADGKVIGTGRSAGAPAVGESNIIFGHNAQDVWAGPFRTTSFNGLLDDLCIYNEALDESALSAFSAENTADFSINASRFSDDLLRPRFHGMPAAGWTNESHGMTYSDGRWHVFFQKNANGPYMARLHWGHISSTDLCNWREEPIAIAPGESYDMKGCWSGAVFSDDEITGGKPNIIYTAVDYAKATIAQAEPSDDSLKEWKKHTSNPIIAGRPQGLGDDFRDPYFWRDGDRAAIIVGSSAGGVGTTTLHRYDSKTGRWSNDGDRFFSGTNAAEHGVFWEMPNVTPMGDGRFLFTVTPLNTSQGVRTLYWTGTIDADWHFRPLDGFTSPKGIEMVSRDGYGLLSPTVFSKDGKTIALGIVPDKLDGSVNHRLGWAHTYSLPREWSLDAKGLLIQKPYEGLSAMRGKECISQSGVTLDGTVSIDGIDGRCAEVEVVFEAGSKSVGIRFFKGAGGEAVLTYNPVTGLVKTNLTGLNRIVNDKYPFDGVYNGYAETIPAKGEECRLHLFIDHSIIDVFVDNRYATSIRVFPNDSDADGIEIFSDAPVAVRSLRAWTLEPGKGAGIPGVSAEVPGAMSGVYDMQGIRVADSSDTVSAPGIYIVDGRKKIIR